MIEFAPGYRQVRVDHLTNNYFPLVTPEPFPEMWINAARNNPAVQFEGQNQQRLRELIAAFASLSTLALLVLESFGRPHEVQGARRELTRRRIARSIGTATAMAL